MPNKDAIDSAPIECIVGHHLEARISGKLNFLGSWIPVHSHFDIPKWKKKFDKGYWDAQLSE